MNRNKITIIVLSVALFALAQYVIYEKIIESRQQEMSNAYKSGYDKGLTDAAVTIYKQTENCQTTTVTIGNLTRNIFDLSCLKVETKNMTR
ncbi:MAG: hypothetical protein ABI342_02870 [Nitrososphaera sp.]|jgi:archaellum component FlaF (FlaF/FlaG flagellin family)